MRRNSFILLFALFFILMAGLSTSAFSAPSPAYQANPTQQHATIEARVNELFTQTAVAGENQTATLDAMTATAHAFETEIIPTRIALTQTAAVENTVQAEFNQRVTATAAFNLAVDARVSELVTATAVAASYRGEIQIDQPITTELENAGGDRWTFDGLAGDMIVVEMSSNTFTPYLELYDPNNQLVATGASDGGGRSRLGFVLTETGTYTLLGRCSSFVSVGESYTLILHTTSIVTIEANDFDTYPGGYQVTVNKYEINEAMNTVRIYFEAKASETDLRPPDGTYIQSPYGGLYPINQDWAADGLTYYSGWMEFDASYFHYNTELHLIYCGCGFYDILLTDLTPYFTFPMATPTPFSTDPYFAYPSPTPIYNSSLFAYPTPTNAFPSTTYKSGSWNFTWDREVVDCPTTQVTYYNFTSNIVISSDGSTLTRTAYGGASVSYFLISPGFYSLTASYTDLSATVTSETLQFLSPTQIIGQRTDIFADYPDCTVSNSYRMEYINGG